MLQLSWLESVIVNHLQSLTSFPLSFLKINHSTDTIQARRLVFDRVGSFSVETDQTGVVRTLSLSIGLFIHVIGDTRNSIRGCMGSYLKSCRPSKAADLGTSGSMLSGQGPRSGFWRKSKCPSVRVQG